MTSLPLTVLASSIAAQIPDFLARISYYEKATADLDIRHTALEEAIKFVKNWMEEDAKQPKDTRSGGAEDLGLSRAGKKRRRSKAEGEDSRTTRPAYVLRDRRGCKEQGTSSPVISLRSRRKGKIFSDEEADEVVQKRIRISAMP